ncbi:MAG: decarboxylating 6-phosphogluconate dehydrogenase [Nitrospirae bacterium]|nr:decarboxylating 6-phosphogluconate dehydrogenase [Nitrospirota bacterium]
MKLGYIGLGKMGSNMVERLLEKGHEVVVFDNNEDAVKNISRHGAEPAYSLQTLASALITPRLIWIMVPHHAVDSVIKGLSPFIQPADTLIDGGNSPYKETIKRSRELQEKGINFLDAGVSGGPSGARTGACIMVGGRKDIFERYEKLFSALSAGGSYGYMGKSGAGHFVKMVHNGIEYGMMQAIAEGFALLKASPFQLNLTEVAEIYNHSSVIESRLVEWLRKAFEEHGEDLDNISGSVSHTGEGSWTVEAAKESGIPMPVIEGALQFRIDSQKNPSYTGRILSALRNQFGGHDVFKRD